MIAIMVYGLASLSGFFIALIIPIINVSGVINIKIAPNPVIASNIPGCIETFEQGVSGFGFKVKNVDSLVEAIIKFIQLPYEEKKSMGIAGRRKIEKEFDRNIVVNAYIDEIDRI